ncbi:MAG: hypothetical protein AAFX99_26115 [Myxococcota bacterium]
MPSIEEAINALPDSGITVTVLNTLDNVVPGEWTNITSFEAMIVKVTGQDSPGVVAAIRDRALALEQDPERHYARALTIFTTLDTLDQVAAGTTVASKVTDFLGGTSLGFLKDLTPKPETTQSVDAALKLAAELLAFGTLRGMPDATFDSITDFAIALQQYGKSDIMRLGSWILIDGLLPLGPNFMGIIIQNIASLANDHMSGNAIFETISNRLPGSTTAEKQSFILKALEAVNAWVTTFVQQHGLSRDMVSENLLSNLNLAESSMDYAAAALDASTNYFSHTGAQTVARVLIEDAYAELREEVWQEWVARQG